MDRERQCKTRTAGLDFGNESHRNYGGVVVILIIGTIVWIWVGAGEAVFAVLGTVALSLIAAWAQLSGNRAARETDEYRDRWISRRRSYDKNAADDE
ncbi:hypothetical protein [Arthrobacter sp. ISL-30]|uniref:hypothetical protein n=1 Tax=Arthrobacter sp. ISL-30 TaxID=2819109 RepID=UPI001BEC640B|nr:hypothetical protein [Arthrobacter sp. ISL-30]MBT2515442.1 hypothetical protein [Arthrobacter sp. ISL-30]